MNSIVFCQSFDSEKDEKIFQIANEKYNSINTEEPISLDTLKSAL